MFSEVSTPDFTNFVLVVSLLLGGATSILVITHYVKSIFFSKVAEDDVLITEKKFRLSNQQQDKFLTSALHQHEEKLRLTAQQFEQVHKDAMLESKAARQDLQAQINNNKEYCHSSIHIMKTDLQALTNNLSLLSQRLQENVLETVKKLETRFDYHDKILQQLGSRVNILIGRIDKDIRHLEEAEKEAA